MGTALFGHSSRVKRLRITSILGRRRAAAPEIRPRNPARRLPLGRSRVARRRRTLLRASDTMGGDHRGGKRHRREVRSRLPARPSERPPLPPRSRSRRRADHAPRARAFRTLNADRSPHAALRPGRLAHARRRPPARGPAPAMNQELQEMREAIIHCDGSPEMLRNLSGLLAHDLPALTAPALEFVMECVQELPVKTPVYATLVGLLNPRAPAFVEEVVRAAIERLEHRLGSDDPSDRTRAEAPPPLPRHPPLRRRPHPRGRHRRPRHRPLRGDRRRRRRAPGVAAQGGLPRVRVLAALPCAGGTLSSEAASRDAFERLCDTAEEYLGKRVQGPDPAAMTFAADATDDWLEEIWGRVNLTRKAGAGGNRGGVARRCVHRGRRRHRSRRSWRGARSTRRRSWPCPRNVRRRRRGGSRRTPCDPGSGERAEKINDPSERDAKPKRRGAHFFLSSREPPAPPGDDRRRRERSRSIRGDDTTLSLYLVNPRRSGDERNARPSETTTGLRAPRRRRRAATTRREARRMFFFFPRRTSERR